MQDIKIIQLDHKIVYEPATHSLYVMGDRASRVTLAIPASLCLLALLQNKGDIVSHDDLLSFAWAARGMNVSPSTVYQNLSILRKSLESVGLSGGVIRTIPKRGWVIPDSFLVEFINELSEDVSVSDENIANHNNNSIPFPPLLLNFKGTMKNQVILKIAFLSLCCTVLYFSYLLSNYLSEDVIPDYIAPDFIKIESASGCNIYRNRSLRNDDFFAKFISGQNLKCGKEKWWYIINYPPSREISLFRCSGELNKNTTKKTSLCASDFYSGGDE